MTTRTTIHTPTALAILASALLSACTAPVLRKDAAPEPRSGYVYAALILPPSARMCDLRTGLALRQVDGDREYVLEFSRVEPVVIFPVEPGRYRIDEFVFRTCEGMGAGRKPLTEKLVPGEIAVESGTAVYLGRYEGETRIDNNIYSVGWNWSVYRMCSDYEDTTARLLRTWPKFAALRTRDGTSEGRICR